MDLCRCQLRNVHEKKITKVIIIVGNYVFIIQMIFRSFCAVPFIGGHTSYRSVTFVSSSVEDLSVIGGTPIAHKQQCMMNT